MQTKKIQALLYFSKAWIGVNSLNDFWILLASVTVLACKLKYASQTEYVQSS